MPLGTEVGLGLGDTVLDRDPVPNHGMEHSSHPNFSANFALARSPISATAELLSVKVRADTAYRYVFHAAVRIKLKARGLSAVVLDMRTGTFLFPKK